MKNRALKYTLILALIGVIVTALMAYLIWAPKSIQQRNAPFLALGGHVRNTVTQTQPLFEKAIVADASVNFDQHIVAPLTSSRDLVQKAYDGADSELGTFEMINDEESRIIFKETINDLDKLIEVAKERSAAHQLARKSVGDSAMEISTRQAAIAANLKYEAVYQRTLVTIDRLSAHLNAETAGHIASFQKFTWIGIGVTAIAFIGISLFFFRLQFKSEKLIKVQATKLDQQGQAVTAVSGFVESISAGNYSIDLELGGDDESANLKNTFIAMRDKLRLNAEEDYKRNWSTTGLAQIGEILRTNSSSTINLYDSILKFVVKYTNSNQGGLFLFNDENDSDPFLELVACYAFERKKFIQKRIDSGQGLVGQCYLEGQRIYLTKVPQEYVSITSGLGGSNPNAVLLVPLRVNEKIFGVLELATFKHYEEYEIELVEKLSESIASTISSVRINESTRILLEKTQQQAEEMRSQEEEMRQNMEELEATQEEMRRKEKHIQDMFDQEKKRNEKVQLNRKVVMELTRNNDIKTGNWNVSIEKVTSSITNQLNVSRCSIWIYNSKENFITCEKLYQHDKRSFESGTVLKGTDFPAYFRALASEETIVAKDAHTHQATSEFSEVYLKPLNIESLLDVPFFHEGKIIGVICCEHQYEQKDWLDEDIEFLKSCADLLAVSYNTKTINLMVDHLNDSQETLQTIIDNIPRAVFWKDRELRFQGCNKIFAQVAGLKSHRDLIGHTDFDMPWREHAEEYRKDDLEVMKNRKSRIDQEEKNTNSEGQISWVSTSKVAVLNSHNEVVAVLGMFEDITERKNKEADISAKLLELEQLKKMLGNKSN
ncbi:MAG: GAF domain-containing protein [Chryseolinea sp.]